MNMIKVMSRPCLAGLLTGLQLLLFCLPAAGQDAQHSADEIRTELQQQELSETALLALAERIEALPFSEAAAALELTRLAQQQAENRGYASAALPLVRIWYRFSFDVPAIETALAQTEALLQRFPVLPDARSRETIEIFRALFLIDLGRQPEALSLLRELAGQSDNPATVAVARANMARVLSGLGQYQLAVEAALEAITYYRNTGDTRTLFNLYYNLNGYYAVMELTELALDAAQTAYAFALQTEDPQLLSDAYLGLGTSWHRSGDPEKAVTFLEQSRELAQGPGMQVRLAQVLLNLGNVYQSSGNHEEAIRNYRQAEALSQDLGQPYGIALSRYNLAVSLQQLGRYAEAIRYYELTAPWFESSGNIKELMLLTEGLAHSLARAGDLERAWPQLLRYNELFRQVYDEENQRTLNEAQTRFETSIREQQLALSLSLNEQQEKQIRLQWALIALLVLGAGAGLAFLRLRDQNLNQLYQRSEELLGQSSMLHAVQPAEAELSDALPVFDADEDTETDAEPSQPEPVGNSAYTKLYQAFVQALEKDKIYQDENLSLKEAARYLKTNEKYLSTAISQHSNTNFSGLVNFWRILEARRLLRLYGDDLPVQEIMHSCGYRSSTTFYNAFKKYTGMTPRQFVTISMKERAKT